MQARSSRGRRNPKGPLGRAGERQERGVRVIYYWATAEDTILMLLTYPQSKRDGLTDAQTKALSVLVEREFP